MTRTLAPLQSFSDEVGRSHTRRPANSADGVAVAADELGADLIVMAESDKRMMMGDTSVKVIGRTTRPLRVVKA